MINPCPLDNHFKFAQGEIDFFLKPFINCFLDYYFSPPPVEVLTLVLGAPLD